MLCTMCQVKASRRKRSSLQGDNTRDGCLPYGAELLLLSAGPQLRESTFLEIFRKKQRGGCEDETTVILPPERLCKVHQSHVSVLHLVLLMRAHIGLKHSYQLLVAVKLLGEVGEPAYLVIASAALAPTNYAAPGHGLSWSSRIAVFYFPLISQEHA